MKIKYTVVYELETTNINVSELDKVGFVKRLNVETIRHRYCEDDTIIIISNDYEITLRGNALEVPN